MPTSTICVDAGLSLKLVLPEPDSPLARALWNEWRTQRLTIVAPSLWAYETTSVIRNRTQRGLLSPDLEEAALDVLQRLPVQLHRPSVFIAAPGNWPAVSTGRRLTTCTMWRWPRCWRARFGRRTNGCLTPCRLKSARFIGSVTTRHCPET